MEILPGRKNTAARPRKVYFLYLLIYFSYFLIAAAYEKMFSVYFLIGKRDEKVQKIYFEIVAACFLAVREDFVAATRDKTAPARPWTAACLCPPVALCRAIKYTAVMEFDFSEEKNQQLVPLCLRARQPAH